MKTSEMRTRNNRHCFATSEAEAKRIAVAFNGAGYETWYSIGNAPHKITVTGCTTARFCELLADMSADVLSPQ